MNCDQHLDKNSEKSLTTSRLRFARALNKKFMKNHVFDTSKQVAENKNLNAQNIQHSTQKTLNVMKTLETQKIHSERKKRVL